MPRKASVLKLGYFPLAEIEAERIRQFLRFPANCAVLDPCAGTGAALMLITGATACRRYGIELDSFRAAAAAEVLDGVVQGSLFDTHCPVESYSLLLLNPPYADEVMDDGTRRTEGVFLEYCFRWLQAGGVLALVINGRRLTACAGVLAAHFRDLSVYRLTAPEAAQYGQVVIFGVRRNRRERDRLRDSEVSTARRWLSDLAYGYQRLAPLGIADRTYVVPPGNPNVQMVYRGLALDTIEDILLSSRAYRQAGRIIFAPQVQVAGRPLTPLHEGHAGILSCAGLLDGVFGRGEDRHVACWQARKVIDRFEETEENGVTVIRERERFTQGLTLIFSDGRTAELAEANDAQCPPANGAS